MPFHYLAKDYGITTYAAFNGCSTKRTNASFATIVSLAKYADELGIKHIMTIEGSDKKLAKAVIENTTAKNQDILTLNSLQSVSQSDIDKGLTYYGAMEENLKVLDKALTRRLNKMTHLITCKNLSVGHERNKVAGPFSLEINSGDYLCVIGENGSGKSTFMKTILGLITPIEGSIEHDDSFNAEEMVILHNRPKSKKISRLQLKKLFYPVLLVI